MEAKRGREGSAKGGKEGGKRRGVCSHKIKTHFQQSLPSNKSTSHSLNNPPSSLIGFKDDDGAKERGKRGGGGGREERGREGREGEGEGEKEGREGERERDEEEGVFYLKMKKMGREE